MRPYLAILKDSFREALASRVLWILLLLITIALLALTPIHIKEDVNWLLTENDIRGAYQVVARIREQGQSAKPSVEQRIWRRLDAPSKKQWSEWLATHNEDAPPWQVKSAWLVEDLNEVIQRRDFYDKPSWSGTSLTLEVRSLLKRERDELDEHELLQLNRRLLEVGLQEGIARSSGETFHFSYFHWDFDRPIADRKQLKFIIDTSIGALIGFFVGMIGVFVAILVTASIIPHTFEAGAVDLLLSKPISRVLLFLTKYIGGCAFILLNAAYFLIGIWLIAGFRLDTWKEGLLMCIPVFLFLFAIYYAVSALAGVIWRNSIVCVVVSILFWALCASVGLTRNSLHTFLFVPKQLDRLVIAGDDFMASNKSGSVVRWDGKAREWQTIFADPDPQISPGFQFGAQLVGPVYDHQNQRLLAVPLQRFPVQRSAETLVWGTKHDEWQRRDGTRVPSGTRRLFVGPDGRLLAVCVHGVYRLAGDPTKPPSEAPITIAGFTLPWSRPEVPTLTSIGSDPWLPLSSWFAVEMDPSTGALAFYDRSVLTILEPDEKGHYSQRRESELQADGEGLLGFVGDTIVVATENGDVLIVDAQQLEVVNRYSPFGDSAPRQVVAGPDGKWFAVGYHNDKWSIVNGQQRNASDFQPGGQGNITTAVFSGPNTLLLADDRQGLLDYRLDDRTSEQRVRPKLTTFEAVYYYLINPAYYVFPKPGDLDAAITYLITDEDTVALNPRANGLEAVRTKIDIWSPVVSSLAFVTVVLVIGSVYVWRNDF